MSLPVENIQVGAVYVGTTGIMRKVIGLRDGRWPGFDYIVVGIRGVFMDGGRSFCTRRAFANWAVKEVEELTP